VVDLYLIGLIGGFAIGGLRTGFVRRLAGLGFLVAAFVVAAYVRVPAEALLKAFLPTVRPEYVGFVAFGVVFAVLLVGLNLASRPFLSRIAVQGLSRRADQGLGVGLGILEGALIASVGIVIVTTYADDALLGPAAGLGLLPDISAALEGSAIARFLMATTVPLVLTVLGPLLPPDIDAVVELLP
jgi:uncharacterized membrane protein required for colicin V production